MTPLDPGTTIVLTVSVFLFGLLLGSFFNVVVWRLPRGESIVSPGSHCPFCDRPVRPYENIPVFSYLWLRGKCAGCRTSIPLRYPTVELITAIAAYAIWQITLLPLLNSPAARWFHLVAATLQAGALLSLIPISLIDLKHFLIFDAFTLPGIVIGLGISFIPGGITPLQSVLGILAGGGSLYAVGFIGEVLLRKKEAMGGGDIKLMAMAGALWGWQVALEAIMFASVLGAFFGGGLLLFKRMREDHRLPFGPFLAAGIWLAALFGDAILIWYFTFVDRLIG